MSEAGKDLSAAPNGALDVSILEKSEDFAALEEEWGNLYRECPSATPFQSWAWLYSWWEHYGGGFELRIVEIRATDGLLVGLIPLMLERRRGFARLLFIGSGPTDYLDVLVREGWEDAVSEVGGRALREIASWHVADLQELRPDAAAWRVFGRWGGLRASIWQEGCPVMTVRPWDELVSTLSRNHRSTVRRALRRAEKDGLQSEPISVSDDVEDAARRLVAVSRDQWRGNPQTGPEHFTRRFEAHLETAARRMTASGLGGIYECRKNGETLISTFMVFGRDFVGTYMVGASQEARQRYQWNTLYIRDAVNASHDRNISCLDLLRGLESYKLRWGAKIVSNRRAILGRGLIRWGLYSIYQAMRSRSKRRNATEA